MYPSQMPNEYLRGNMGFPPAMGSEYNSEMGGAQDYYQQNYQYDYS